MEPSYQAADPNSAENVIQLKLREVSQLFNSLDPSPFNAKDLDHDAEEFIVSWARELSPKRDLKLVIHLEKPLSPNQTEDTVRESVQHYFAYRASINRLELRELLKRGRTSLLIGGCFLSGCLFLGKLVAEHTASGVFGGIARESLTIGGWVAMWRPMEIYLYDWWPLSHHGTLLTRLSHIQVELRLPTT